MMLYKERGILEVSWFWFVCYFLRYCFEYVVYFLVLLTFCVSSFLVCLLFVFIIQALLSFFVRSVCRALRCAFILVFLLVFLRDVVDQFSGLLIVSLTLNLPTLSGFIFLYRLIL